MISLALLKLTNMRIFVGNLSDLATANHLSNLFVKFGAVLSVYIMEDDTSGHSLGYGFVEMDNVPGAMAIAELDSCRFMNRYMDVNEV
jgi:RNA recognition motif-containing protein